MRGTALWPEESGTDRPRASRHPQAPRPHPRGLGQTCRSRWKGYGLSLGMRKAQGSPLCRDYPRRGEDQCVKALSASGCKPESDNTAMSMAAAHDTVAAHGMAPAYTVPAGKARLCTKPYRHRSRRFPDWPERNRQGRADVESHPRCRNIRLVRRWC